MSDEAVEGHEVIVYEAEPVNTDLVLPHSGQIIDRSDENQVAAALSEIKRLKSAMWNMERELRAILATHASVMGTKTLHIPEVGKVELKDWTKVTWDEEKLEDLLRQAGAPEELIREIVVETCTLKVSASRAERAAKANPEYAAAVAACRFEEPAIPTATFS